MGGLSAAVQDFYNGGDLFLFQELIRRVNCQAIGPFFRTKLRRHGRVLDAGSGAGFLADELGLHGACFMDLSWGQIVRCRQRRRVGSFIQTDLESLPFRTVLLMRWSVQMFCITAAQRVSKSFCGLRKRAGRCSSLFSRTPTLPAQESAWESRWASFQACC